MTLGYDDTGQPRSLVDLRPMDVGDVLDNTIRVYRSNWLVFIGIWAVILSVPTYIQLSALQYFINILTSAMLAAPDAGPEALNVFQSEEFYLSLGVLGIAAFLMFFLAPIAQAAMVFGVSETILGREPGIRESIIRVLPKAGTIILAYFLLGIIMVVTYLPIILFVALISSDPLNYAAPMALTFLFPVSGVLLLYLTVKLLFIPHAIILDDVGAVDAFRRSFSLVTGYWWRVFGIYILVSLIVQIIVSLLNQGVSLINMGLGLIPGMTDIVIVALGGVLMTVISLVIQPIVIIATTLLYYDLRIRKEGFDLLHLASALVKDEYSPTEPSEQLPFG